jgi:SAM-dependent methyltransferase
LSVERYYEHYWSEEGYNPARPIARALRRELAKQLAGPVECLDVGCGDGRAVGSWLAERAGRYIGVDISATAVTHARDLGLDARQIEDATALPFDDGSFDVVVCMEVLEHLFEPDRAATEALRVLRPGGTYLATVPNVAYWRLRSKLLRGEWDPFGDADSVDSPWRDPHIRFFTDDAFERMLKRVGFAPVEVYGHEGEIGAARRLARLARAHQGTQERTERWLHRMLLSTMSMRFHAVAHKPG